MALVRWNPATELDAFRRQMDRLFNEMTGDRALTPQWGQLPIELNDAGNNLELKAQVPGMNPDDLDVTVNRDSVTISGEYRRENEGENSYGSEFQYGKFSRTIGLPVGIQQDQVQADYNNGLLTLHLPKVEEATNKKVKINFGDQQAIAGSSGQS
ncbi:Hsp20/alpha crystallin family protein [Euhalothece natronophila Z-M001]|uniref:Hsp20/alpha crystallin family protein n=1 Tax=Euhalothece natronophila Z-M001 TaxID=522448 RepID=A0A5B8NLK8_9CHRO|nr:Hsp20/alpha crystallin family protein [Euhalothece natronophila]QDZ39817.1 Hsp20/alpha crystallin family protein [Euhalothece natronophila Z-M001]